MNNPTRKISSKRAEQKLETAAASHAKTEKTISDELEIMLHAAFVNARAQRHKEITVEHLLFALLEVEETKKTLLACGADIDDLKSMVSVFIDENTPIDEGRGEVDVQPTVGFRRVIQRAIMYAQTKTHRKPVSCNDVLIALYSEKESDAVYFLHHEGITRVDIQNYLSEGIKKLERLPARSPVGIEGAEETTAGREFFTLVSEATRPFVPSEERPAKSPKLFISYSHVDTPCLERLLVHLKPLERANTIVCWSDKRIRTGDKWKAEIENNLDDAAIAILLVSADFLASDFVVNNELPPLLIKADAKGLRILPVILKPCGFRRDPVLSTFQSANDPTTPLLGMTSIEQEAVYDKIAEEVAREVSVKLSVK